MYNSGIGTPYWFEWEIGILECLNMLQDTSIESVILQSTDFQALDDVVVNYSDKSILNIQVKHTDEDANFTYSFLASGKKPLLNELALEWKNNKDCPGFFSDITCGGYSCMYKRRSKKRETEYQRCSDSSKKRRKKEIRRESFN